MEAGQHIFLLIADQDGLLRLHAQAAQDGSSRALHAPCRKITGGGLIEWNTRSRRAAEKGLDPLCATV